MTDESKLQEIIRKAVEPLPGLPSEQAERVSVAVTHALTEATGGPDHLLKLEVTEGGTLREWTVQHPLHERFDGSLFDCKYGPITNILVLDIEESGTYRLYEDRTAILWEKL